ncbi:lanC-like protein 2 [Actinia tenebrosa]|uniref:LanC-like protein 2 n=1 Tax=Actinia tenebrosa TaxID=6105 RepID=A0A6P8IAM6_ACTTE|nr:lanC-like protein 2 [Actinia tenebrosa]
MASRDVREFENRFSDYDGSSKLVGANGQLNEPFYTRLKQGTLKLLSRFEEGFEDERNDHDYSVYTGTGGVAYLFMHLARTLFKDDPTKKEEYLNKALEMLEIGDQKLKGRRCTFLCGDAGILAQLAVLYFNLNKPEKSKKCLTRLESMCDRVCKDPSLPDEVLYGRSGYLYSLLYVQQELGQDKIKATTLNEVCSAIIASGQRLAKQERHTSPLMYMWHEKHYVGAAHGIVGILYMLLQAQSTPAVQSNLAAIERSIDFLLTQQFPSGNFHSSLENPTDKLVHWCHGASGAVYLMLKAYKVFGKDKYLTSALKCGELIWNKGLLRKGYGICHGVSGNAYAFLSLYKATDSHKYIYRAIKFAEWCLDYGKHGCRIPDTPFSLFEGMAGTVYFLVDVLVPGSSLFPAFEFKE